MASLTHVCMWSDKGWKRITAEEAARLHPGGTVSAHSGLFMCELCGQYVILTDGDIRKRYFKHNGMRIMKNELIENIDKVHTTEMGVDRIRRNLGLGDIDVVVWCKSRILDKNADITRQGKNWYVRNDGCVITVNASSYTIITAHKEKKAEQI